MFKIFPARGKIPIKKGWQTEASADPEVHKMWSDLYRGQFDSWCIPTGPINDLLVLDVDMKGNGYETLKGKELPATMWQRTPSGGAHYLFKYPQDGRRYGNRTKFEPGLDLRGDGGYIIFYGGAECARAEPPTWVREAAQARELPQTTDQQDAYKVAPEIASQTIQKSLDAIREAPPGERNNVLNREAFKVGQLVKSGSITREYAEAALYRAASDAGLQGYEVMATVESGLAGGSKKPLTSPFGDPKTLYPMPGMDQPRWTPIYFTHEDLLNTSKLRRPQLFENWSTEDIHITTADGGTGKTTMKLFEAVCLALGERFLGFQCIQPGKTLFITGEDTDKKLGAIIGQILRQMGLLEDPAYNDKVRTVLDSIAVKKDANLCLIVKDPKTGFLRQNPHALENVMQAVSDIKPKMIVFDPISSFWGSESALNDMAKAVIKFMSELGN